MIDPAMLQGPPPGMGAPPPGGPQPPIDPASLLAALGAGPPGAAPAPPPEAAPPDEAASGGGGGSDTDLLRTMIGAGQQFLDSHPDDESKSVVAQCSTGPLSSCTFRRPSVPKPSPCLWLSSSASVSVCPTSVLCSAK